MDSLKMARCSLCLGDPCVCPKPIGIAPLGLVLGAVGFVLRRRAADILDAAAQVTYGLLCTGLVGALWLAVQR